MVELLVVPEKYHDKLVRVIGYVKLEFEGDGVYLHRDDYLYVNSKNALCLNLEGASGLSKVKGPTYAIVEGVVNAYDDGHEGTFRACIHRVNIRPITRPRKD